jgi:hypothetical protein
MSCVCVCVCLVSILLKMMCREGKFESFHHQLFDDEDEILITVCPFFVLYHLVECGK